ncbi:MAG: hypothetical protein NXI24_13985 [bacterium]|nr:hypothetical protein [bacterium]
MSTRESQKIAKSNQFLFRPALRPAKRILGPLLALALAQLLAMATAPEAPRVIRTPDPVESLAFSSDGTVLAAAFDGRAQLIHIPPAAGAADGSFPVLGAFHGAACTLRSPAFSPDSLLYYGRRRDCAGPASRSSRSRAARRASAANAGDAREIPIYDLATGRVAHRLGPHAGYLKAIGMSADGRRLASASDDGQLRIWSVADGRLLRSTRLPRLTDPRRVVQPFAFDPQLELIAVHDWRDYYMVMIEVETGRVLHKTEYPFRAGEQPLFVFAPDGQSYFDGRRIRASRSGEPVSTIEFNFALIPGRAVFSPDGQQLALLQLSAGGQASASSSTATSASSSTVEIYTVATGALYSSYTVTDRLISLAWHPEAERRILAAGGYSGRIYLREFESLP